MVEGILVGIFGSTAYETLKKLVKKVFGDIHEDDPIINKTYQVGSGATGKSFGIPIKKF